MIIIIKIYKFIIYMITYDVMIIYLCLYYHIFFLFVLEFNDYIM